eukprot:SM000023S07604  [mRNA]  locus=s23:431536:436657:+ [translate_table: standard]
MDVRVPWCIVPSCSCKPSATKTTPASVAAGGTAASLAAAWPEGPAGWPEEGGLAAAAEARQHHCVGLGAAAAAEQPSHDCGQRAPELPAAAPLVALLVAGLEELGYSWAYRVVDTRAFGLPQRRRRVFLLAALYGDPRDLLLAQTPPLGNRCWVLVAAPSGLGGHDCFRCFQADGQAGAATAAAAATVYALDLSCWDAPGNRDCLPTLTTTNGRRLMLVLPDRRRAALLSITAAEYAQGFPPDWTAAAGDDGLEGSTSSASKEGGGGLAARFAMVGNAVSVPVAQWLGERLADPLSHKYVHGESDRALPTGDSLAAWPAAAWGHGIGQRFEATALLASGFAETPVLLPFRPLGAAGCALVREGLRAADVLRYARKMRDAGMILHPDVRGTLAAAFGLKERDMAKPRAERRTLVWAACPAAYSPRHWPAAQPPDADIPASASSRRPPRSRASGTSPAVFVQFMDGTWLWVEAVRPYLEHRDEMERQPNSAAAFLRHCQRARREFEWSSPSLLPAGDVVIGAGARKRKRAGAQTGPAAAATSSDLQADGGLPRVEPDEPAEPGPARSLRPLRSRATRAAGCPLPPPPLLPPPLVAVVRPTIRARRRALLNGPHFGLPAVQVRLGGCVAQECTVFACLDLDVSVCCTICPQRASHLRERGRTVAAIGRILLQGRKDAPAGLELHPLSDTGGVVALNNLIQEQRVKTIKELSHQLVPFDVLADALPIVSRSAVPTSCLVECRSVVATGFIAGTRHCASRDTEAGKSTNSSVQKPGTILHYNVYVLIIVLSSRMAMEFVLHHCSWHSQDLNRFHTLHLIVPFERDPFCAHCLLHTTPPCCC